MDEDGEERVRAKRSGEVDWISNLPDSLRCLVLLKLCTKDVVKCSVLSSRWRSIWKCVPGLDLEIRNFPEHDSFVSFVDSFLGFNSDSLLQNFKLRYACYGDDEPEIGLIRRWINTVVRLKVETLYLMDDAMGSYDLHLPPTLYTCESLVCLKLCGVTMASPKFVSLPFLKVMDLIIVHFPDDLALETMISRCPVLESLYIERNCSDDIQVLRVCSQSLLSFTHFTDRSEDLAGEFVVVIDAPRLKYLALSDYRIASIILKSPGSLVEARINTVCNSSFDKKFDPNDLPRISMIRNFLVGISCVKDLIIASSNLEVICDYSRCEPLPLFCSLSFLCVQFTDYSWEMLPIFLASCPNLKSLVVGCYEYPEKEGISITSGPRCLLSSLEYAEIERPLKGEAMEMKLVSYLLENSKILKKLTVYLDDSRKKEESAILKELLNIPRLSNSCRVVVL